MRSKNLLEESFLISKFKLESNFMLLRVRSARLEILGFPMGGAY